MRFLPPPGYQPIYNPVIPYVGPIYGGLRIGMSLYVQGTIRQESFAINLQCGEAAGCDIALHFNSRFGPEDVVFNSKKGGCWGSEERPTDKPFHRGENVEIVFIITLEGYQVKVNGSDYYLFKHRMPVEQVSSLAVHGFSVQSITIIGGGQGDIQGYPGLGEMVSIPYVEPIYGGLRTGMSVYIQGMIVFSITRFHISLHCAEDKCCDKALYINPRFSPSELVVFNSFQNGKFEEQERVLDMPFSQGETFELEIVITTEGYQVNVNGRQYYMFKHRIPLERVMALQIAGDVFVRSVNIIGGEQGVIQGYPGPEDGEQVIQKYPGPGDVSNESHTQPIDGGLKAGTSLYFEGTVNSYIDRFRINLQCGRDVALHFRADLKYGILVLNTFKNDDWGKEERLSYSFSKGKDFQLVFIITSEGYQVIVNACMIHMYKHRIPVDRVSSLVIGGTISVQAINIITGGQEGIQECPGPGDVSSKSHTQPIDGSLKPGTSVYFEGTVHSEIDRFRINLQCGRDVALHFRADLKYGILVLNTFKNDDWGKEERLSYSFSKGKDFQLVFIITSEGYQVIVNGRKIHMYKHRIPVDRVSSLVIGGTISVQAINIIRGSTDGEGEGGTGYNWRFLPMMGTEPIFNPPVPYTGMIPGGMIRKKTIVIRGKVLPGANRFEMNFGSCSSEDLALHVNPRMSERSVVRNSWLHGSWGMDERNVNFNPFQEGQSFEILIRCGSQKMKFFGNGKHMFDYVHRLQPFTKIDKLHIAGDVQLFYILF